jgi:hypothetical protein
MPGASPIRKPESEGHLPSWPMIGTRPRSQPGSSILRSRAVPWTTTCFRNWGEQLQVKSGRETALTCSTRYVAIFQRLPMTCSGTCARSSRSEFVVIALNTRRWLPLRPDWTRGEMKLAEHGRCPASNLGSYSKRFEGSHLSAAITC